MTSETRASSKPGIILHDNFYSSVVKGLTVKVLPDVSIGSL